MLREKDNKVCPFIRGRKSGRKWPSSSNVELVVKLIVKSLALSNEIILEPFILGSNSLPLLRILRFPRTHRNQVSCFQFWLGLIVHSWSLHFPEFSCTDCWLSWMWQRFCYTVPCGYSKLWLQLILTWTKTGYSTSVDIFFVWIKFPMPGRIHSEMRGLFWRFCFWRMLRRDSAM